MLAPSCQAQVLGPLCSEVVGTLNQILGSGNSTTLFGFEHLYLGTRAQSLWQRSPALKLEFRVFPKFPFFFASLRPQPPAGISTTYLFCFWVSGRKASDANIVHFMKNPVPVVVWCKCGCGVMFCLCWLVKSQLFHQFWAHGEFFERVVGQKSGFYVNHDVKRQ